VARALGIAWADERTRYLHHGREVTWRLISAAISGITDEEREMTLRDRIGIDIGRKLSLEDAVRWATEHSVLYIDMQLDTGANALGTIDSARASALRGACERQGIHLGLHTASAVNVAEYAPYVGDAVERYLEAYVDAAVLLGAEWI